MAQFELVRAARCQAGAGSVGGKPNLGEQRKAGERLGVAGSLGGRAVAPWEGIARARGWGSGGSL